MPSKQYLIPAFAWIAMSGITAATNMSNIVFMTCSHAQHVKTLETENNGLGLSRPTKIPRSLLIGLMNW